MLAEQAVLFLLSALILATPTPSDKLEEWQLMSYSSIRKGRQGINTGSSDSQEQQ